ncbi:MAG: Rpn family recombination-promoting nuclease/putative transposase [Treponema sp.]|nr:Rpn family recombination-promoting nuclease/putative transposase [Treponema sp.]MCL2251868.1 Rpn family recombination-promoting nuclease/putative transposase [Treponema sp.]
MKKLEYTFKTDRLFKTLFVKHPDLLQHLVSELLNIRLESIEQFLITNPEMPPEAMRDKFCRLDVNMIVNKQRVNLEIQVKNEGNYPERVLYHWAREYSTALPSSKDYKVLPRTIIINIIDFPLFDCSEFHSEFQLLEVSRRELLSDKMCFHFFELTKIPDDINADNMLLLWLALFKADTEEELTKIKSLEVKIMDQAINAYYNITAESELRERERLWEKARHDEAQALSNAKEEEREIWQSIVADKDAEIAQLKAQLEALNK